MQPGLQDPRIKGVRAATLFGRASGLLFLAFLAASCHGGDEAPLAILGEGGLSVDASPPIHEEVLHEEVPGTQRSAGQFGGSAVDFDDLVLFPLFLPGPGLNTFSADCDFDSEPFSSCL